MPRTSPRARPMSPVDRRAALTAATLPLLLVHGTTVTTRQIAEAAGVAEGTLFRVFPDKGAIIRATLDAAMDPAPLYEELAGVDTKLTLRPRLVAITTILQRRLVNVIALMMAVGMREPPGELEARRASNHTITATIAPLLSPDHGQLRLPPPEVARLLRLLIFSGSHPLITDGTPLTAEEIVTLLLDGVLVHESADPAERSLSVSATC